MGFATPRFISGELITREGRDFTSYCPYGTTSAVVIYNTSIGFNKAFLGEVATITGIGDLVVFQDLDRDLYRVDRRCSVLQEGHCSSSCTEIEQN